MRTRRTPLTGRARGLRRDGTDVERKLWYCLRDRRLDGHKFRRQLPVGPYVVDFACVESRLVVELDGGQHAERTAQDAARTRFIEARGFRVLRFWNSEALAQTETVLHLIREALRTRSSLFKQ